MTLTFGLQDEQHEADTMKVDQGDLHSQRSMDFWQVINDEQPYQRRTCNHATAEYNSIYHNNGNYYNGIIFPLLNHTRTKNLFEPFSFSMIKYNTHSSAVGESDVQLFTMMRSLTRFSN